tara:strand:+ start:442 stop:552 length:111 start_codon:yes stop_codon:yes gene_type:complete
MRRNVQTEEQISYIVIGIFIGIMIGYFMGIATITYG